MSGDLEKIAQDSLYAAGVNFNSIKHAFEILRRYIHGRSLLEMGPAEGIMTDELVKLGLDYMVVEGAKLFCDRLAERYPQITVVHSLFEEFTPSRGFDNIVLGHVLEHVEDPVELLRRAATWLNDDGVILAGVPNSRSLHRQAAVIMGLLGFEEELNDLDRHHGHLRVYNPETFRRDFIQAGLKIQAFGGYWLKPVSNAQLEEHWTPQMLDAFMALGERYPDIAAEIYLVATL